nr:gamma-glutamyltransferase [Burkholderia pseudomallei]
MRAQAVRAARYVRSASVEIVRNGCARRERAQLLRGAVSPIETTRRPSRDANAGRRAFEPTMRIAPSSALRRCTRCDACPRNSRVDSFAAHAPFAHIARAAAVRVEQI